MNNQFKSIIDMIDKRYSFVFFDVGAMGGIQRKWVPLKNNMEVVGFEPDSRAYSSLSTHKSIKYFNYALNDTSHDLKYYITKSSGKSSIFKPNKDILSLYEDDERFNIVREEVIPASKVQALDRIMEENSIDTVDFIKLDTQGSELHILKGGQKRLIPYTFGVQIEVEFIEMYKQQPLFRHIDEFFDSYGFVLMDLRRQYWKRKDFYRYRGKGQLIFGDALYFKKTDIFCNDISIRKDLVYAKAKILKGVLICFIYKTFDYAVALVKAALEHGIFTHDEYEKVIAITKKYAQQGIPLGMHLGKMYSMLNLILQKFKPPSYLGWSDGDAGISNVKDI
jgi:FkbM family methyltransferase